VITAEPVLSRTVELTERVGMEADAVPSGAVTLAEGAGIESEPVPEATAVVFPEALGKIAVPVPNDEVTLAEEGGRLLDGTPVPVPTGKVEFADVDVSTKVVLLLGTGIVAEGGAVEFADGVGKDEAPVPGGIDDDLENDPDRFRSVKSTSAVVLVGVDVAFEDAGGKLNEGGAVPSEDVSFQDG